MGDMAVSNSIGSNVFDILVGLGLPWALKTLAINYGSDVSADGWTSHLFGSASLKANRCGLCHFLKQAVVQQRHRAPTIEKI